MKQRRNPLASRRGMTLLEVVIATVILAASLAVLGQLLAGARTAVDRSVAELEALQQVESAMAETAVELGAGIDAEALDETVGGWRVTRATETFADSNLRRVTVVVSSAGERAAVRVEQTRLILFAESTP